MPLTFLEGLRSVSGLTKDASEISDPLLDLPPPLSKYEATLLSLPKATSGGSALPCLQTTPAPILNDSVVTLTSDEAHHCFSLKDSRVVNPTSEATHDSSSLKGSILLPVPLTKQTRKLLQQSSNSAFEPPLSYIPVHNDKTPASGPSFGPGQKGREHSLQRNIQQVARDLKKDFDRLHRLRWDSRQVMERTTVSVLRMENQTQQLVTQVFTNRHSTEYNNR